MKNEHLIPKIIIDLVENRNAAWKSEQQKLVEEARLLAIWEYIDENVVKRQNAKAAS